MTRSIRASIAVIALVVLAGAAAVVWTLASLDRERQRAARAFGRCRGVRVVGTVGGDVARLCLEPEGRR